MFFPPTLTCLVVCVRLHQDTPSCRPSWRRQDRTTGRSVPSASKTSTMPITDDCWRIWTGDRRRSLWSTLRQRDCRTCWNRWCHHDISIKVDFLCVCLFKFAVQKKHPSFFIPEADIEIYISCWRTLGIAHVTLYILTFGASKSSSHSELKHIPFDKKSSLIYWS